MAETQKRRPVAAQRAGAPEKVAEGERTRDAEEAASEESERQAPRVRQITGGEVHWFSGGRLARETR